MTLTERIKSLCEQRGISLSGLSLSLGFSKSAMSLWDKNIPAADKLQKVADYFDVSVDYLLGRVDDPAALYPRGIVVHSDGMDDVSKKIEYLLSRSKEKKASFCDAIGIKPSVLSDWLAGKNESYMKYIGSIADYFNVSVDYLLGRVDDPAALYPRGIVVHSDGRVNTYDDISDAERAMLDAVLAAYRAQHNNDE